MGDLVCTRCGREATYADAAIADAHKTCGSDAKPSTVPGGCGSVKLDYGGDEHEWEERDDGRL